MNHSLGVGIFQRIANLRQVAEGIIRGEVSGGENLPQRGAIHPLHDKVAEFIFLAEVIDLHHVGMIKNRESVGFTLEPLGEFRKAGQLGIDHLESHNPVQFDLARLVDHPHATAGQRFEDFNPSEACACFERDRSIICTIIVLTLLFQHPRQTMGTTAEAGGEVGLVGLPAIGAGRFGFGVHGLPAIHGVLVHFASSLAREEPDSPMSKESPEKGNRENAFSGELAGSVQIKPANDRGEQSPVTDSLRTPIGSVGEDGFPGVSRLPRTGEFGGDEFAAFL